VATLTSDADRKSRSVNHDAEDFDVERPVGTQLAAYNNLGDDLRRALAANELEVYYQPIVSIETRRSVCMEALVRWRHPLLGLLSPDKFIPLAEDTGLINLLGEQVLRQACSDAVRWPVHINLAVNISPVQFQGADLATRVAGILRTSGLPSKRLELEITESVLLQRSSQNIGTLHELHDIGASIALDDFGTGYSSLSYLRMFPFDKIKIDKLFVSEMSHVDVCAAIVCAIANLGRSLHIVTTAEGVETEEQFELLRAAGCTQAQGYLFGRPRPANAVAFDDEIGRVSAPKATTLTAQDVMLVRSSFALVVPIQDDIATLFYDRVFAVAPEVRRLFAKDMSGQKLKLMALLTTCIGKLHDFPTLVPSLKQLGVRHAAYGARTEHYAIIGEALFRALEVGLGNSFTQETRSAWTKAYNALAVTMQAGAAAACSNKGHESVARPCGNI
jgi:EAL domain-containing protein (putative c-di-GMP-specific phosphodiesterase class I)/hemoglobin-like flavoprotein